MDFERVRPCALCFRPEVGEEFDAALRAVAIFLKGNMELAGQITLLNGIEAKHADQREHPAKCREMRRRPNGQPTRQG
jgi:hypothetical protein